MSRTHTHTHTHDDTSSYTCKVRLAAKLKDGQFKVVADAYGMTHTAGEEDLRPGWSLPRNETQWGLRKRS